jgi:hypothetical protein
MITVTLQAVNNLAVALLSQGRIKEVRLVSIPLLLLSFKMCDACKRGAEALMFHGD